MEVTFAIDANGILSVSALDKGTGKEEEITITAERTAASKEEIDEMLRRAEEFAEEDKMIREKIEARNGLENFVYSVKNQIADEDGKGPEIPDEDKEDINDAIKEIIDWIEANPDAGLSMRSLSSFFLHLFLFRSVCAFRRRMHSKHFKFFEIQH